MDTTEIKLDIHLAEMLAKQGVSIREFARRIDYRFDTVRQLHNGTIKRIPTDLIARACRELNCGVGDLFTVPTE